MRYVRMLFEKMMLFIDGAKRIGLYIGNKYLGRRGAPKYIIIPAASGLKVYINAKYKNNSKGDQP